MASASVPYILHHEDRCEHTGCLHCSQCRLGPQPSLTYRYSPTLTDGLPGTAMSYRAGLCSHCAGLTIPTIPAVCSGTY